MEGFICLMAYSRKRIDESYINTIEKQIARAYTEAMKQYLSSGDTDLERFVQRYSDRKNILAPARHTMNMLLKRKISINDVAEFMDIDFNALSKDESDMLKDEILMAINNPLETIGQDNFDELLRGFLHI